jgi:hypothetical protein
LVEALQIIDSNVRFSRPWYDKVPLIDPALLEVPPYKTPRDANTQRKAGRKVKRRAP